MPGYTDLRTNYLLEPGDAIVTGSAALHESLDNIVQINKRSVFFYRAFGSTLISLVHRPMTEITGRLILNYFVFAVREFEPRVEVDRARSKLIGYRALNAWRCRIRHTDPLTGDEVVYDRWLEREGRGR